MRWLLAVGAGTRSPGVLVKPYVAGQITIVAVWLYVAALISLLLAILLPFPELLFGFKISGTGTGVLELFRAGILFVLATGLMRSRSWARAGAIAFCIFAIANANANYFQRNAARSLRFASFLRPGTIPGLIATIALPLGALYFLVRGTASRGRSDAKEVGR
ncbi:MAG: hypothetical protein ACYDDI_15590 [Candidatus Acidiferrales bacterium]